MASLKFPSCAYVPSPNYLLPFLPFHLVIPTHPHLTRVSAFLLFISYSLQLCSRLVSIWVPSCSLACILALSYKSDLQGLQPARWDLLTQSIITDAHSQVFSDSIRSDYPSNRGLIHVCLCFSSAHCHRSNYGSSKTGHLLWRASILISMIIIFSRCRNILLAPDIPVHSCALRHSFSDDYHEASVRQLPVVNTRTP